MSSHARWLNVIASVSLICLIILDLAWEAWLAPLRPGGSWLVLKALPLLAPLFGILHGRRYTHQWTSMLVLLYLIEGIVRMTSETGTAALLAAAETALASILFVAAVAYARSTRPDLPD